jgi:beta-N-acetylhexosaminidase
MYKILIISLFTITLLSAKSLEHMISKMIIIGFDGTTDIKFDYPIGGVILFDKNIKSKEQLKELTRGFSDMLVCVDQEGGLVQRLKFINTPSAKKVSLLGEEFAKHSYAGMAVMLKDVGINCNFAPSVDLAINPKNRVIVQNKRSFSSDPKVVIKYASIFVNQMNKEGILTALKHFPGHGSSYGDSHEGFVDVSKTWNKIELEPFKNIDTKMIMTAHIFNKNIDKDYPATLSYKTNQILLREKLGFNGVIISDDMQMGAIRKNYTLKNSLKLAINSGVDILLFGNQVSKPIEVKEIVSIIKELVEDGEIDIKTIELANDRIERLL